MKELNLEKELEFLKQSKKEFFWFYEEMMKADGGKIFPLDLLATGIIHRSILIISWFSSLIEKKNFLSAAPLIRLHLDNLLHFYAAFKVKDPHKYSLDKIKWKHTNELKDSTWQKLTDGYLVQLFCKDPENKEFTELAGIYKETSWFIHFSDKHIFSAVQSNGITATVCLSEEMNMPIESELAAIRAMTIITQWIFKYLIWWIYTKNHSQIKNN